ncbi:MAG TPA: hypothetical protein VGQ99_04635 [Tepidisphaeraceae bacterium]|nr:hypothetical protein [Tepidisphaeraceae bacterium]
MDKAEEFRIQNSEEDPLTLTLSPEYGGEGKKREEYREREKRGV